ncbi:hypothetical protein KL929_001373 [Ogataea haglerorum]|nr:hypothetical protein KL910_000881 [Ogataea haglerorum]KAG7793037.1 hypothetical protein KL945_000142 [Ogataea haglerorum]KAG7799296.1 hypothetical protein KL929_001373 [Ogataea haglerorum]KAG7803020.1 hypothetical protein KL944_001912 [Ogataea haglerorum]
MFGSTAGSSSFGGSNASKPAFSFGNTQNNAQAGSQPNSTGALFGANNNNSANSTNLFGANSNTNNASTGFGSANTSNSGGLFGNNTTSGGLFGQNNASTAPKPAFSFGNNPNNTNQTGASANTGFSFGGATNTQNNTQTGTQSGTQSGSLFGSSSTPAPSTNTGFSFGGANNATNNTSSTSTGLFGNKPGGLFGQPSQSSGTGSSLFGGNQQPGSGGLLGNQQNTTGTSGSLFGNQQNSSSGGTTSFLSNQQNTSGTSGALFGNQQQNTNLSQSELPPLNPMTKVSDLPEAFQKELEQLDQYIQTQVAIAERLKNDEDEHKELINSIPRDIDFLEKRYFSTNQALNSDLKFVESFKNKTLENFDNWVEKLIKVYLQLTNPMILGMSNNEQAKSADGTVTQIIGVKGVRTAGLLQSQASKSQQLDKDSHVNVPQILNSYYSAKIEEFRQNIEKYQLILQEVENSISDLDKVSLSGGPATGSYGLDMIVSTLKEEFQLYVELANEFAEVHHQVKRLDDGSI